MRARIFFATLATVLISATAAWSAERADTGKIIMSFAGTNWHEFQSWRFDFRSLDGKHTDWMSFIASVPLLSDHRDFEGADDYGAVRILSLPAGEWEINTFSLSYATTTFTPRSDVSVRFTVKAGEATYIGSYMTIMTGITSGISYRMTGGYIIVSDQHARDLAIAAKKDDALGPVTIAIPRLDMAHQLFVPDQSVMPAANTEPSDEITAAPK